MVEEHVNLECCDKKQKNMKKHNSQKMNYLQCYSNYESLLKKIASCWYKMKTLITRDFFGIFNSRIFLKIGIDFEIFIRIFSYFRGFKLIN